MGQVMGYSQPLHSNWIRMHPMYYYHSNQPIHHGSRLRSRHGQPPCSSLFFSYRDTSDDSSVVQRMGNQRNVETAASSSSTAWRASLEEEDHVGVAAGRKYVLVPSRR